MFMDTIKIFVKNEKELETFIQTWLSRLELYNRPTVFLQRGKTPPTSVLVAQSAGAAEYNDCISAEGKTLPKRVLDMTLNNLMVMLQECCSFRKCGVPLYCHHSQVHSGPE